MKSTIVPAQITTVEDKIAGNLSLSQLILLCTPIFIDGVLYILFPPGLKFASYKVFLSIVIGLLFVPMAIRIKGKILLLWMIVIARYNLRPRYYLFDKNDTYLRNSLSVETEVEVPDEAFEAVMHERVQQYVVDLTKLAPMERLLSEHRATVAVKPNKKGGLHVILTEVE